MTLPRGGSHPAPGAGRAGPHAAPGAGRAGPPDVRVLAGRQLRRALVTVAAVLVLLLGVPVIAVWVPAPGAWVALSMAVQVAWVALAVLQFKRAERLER
ncbi:hypothetical protein HII36_29090 [Nonomuraea sp. NN258]|uniref:hypothetical protein n=1 Tax=Nonomuraea antri TaxID=2730852 RepID=UPI001567FC6D|nr:hypothetical protein [Nonomuraea antri]NRQ35860.1 hypothetical protein [Nonomuraea antri]